MDENPHKSPSEEASSMAMASPRFLRTLGVSLARVVATLLVLTPLMLLGTSSSFFIRYRWFLIPITGFLLFPAGVYLHWILAKKTETYNAWVYWLIFLICVPMLSAVPFGTIVGVITISVLYTSETFQQMRHGKPSRRDERNARGQPL